MTARTSAFDEHCWALVERVERMRADGFTYLQIENLTGLHATELVSLQLLARQEREELERIARA